MSGTALPRWTPPQAKGRRASSLAVRIGAWRVSQNQLLLVIGLSLVAMVWLTTGSSRQPEWRRTELAASLPERREAVREAMQFVWKNYHKRAFGADEIKPLNGAPSNPWGGVGCMILDSMDTLWIMDLKDEFEQARQWVHEELRFDEMGQVSVFETIIRSLGGLLSAYDLSKDRVFLTKAVDLAERLLPAINMKTGRANYLLDTNTNHSFQAGTLAESGTYQLEFEYLSVATGNPKYSEIAKKFYPYLRKQDKLQLRGLYANQIYAFDQGHERSGRSISFGGSGDSFYEYLLKVWLFTGQKDDSLPKEMYLDAINGMEALLLDEAHNGQLFISDFSMVMFIPRANMHHLACFVPGMLTLGAKRMQSEDRARSLRHLLTAKKLMKTCYEEFYARQPSGLSPECLTGKDLDNCQHQDYKLRPEVVESLYVMYQLTGDTMYQEWGWNIFMAIQRHCRTTYGYSEYRDVTKVVDWNSITDEVERDLWTVRMLSNRMETFFSAETLKYLYLLFDPENRHVNLDTHVFNTEAHPLSIPTE